MTGKPVRRKVAAANLHWAIGQSPYDFAAFLKKFPKLNSWMDGSIKPTILQLKKFADYADVPVGYLLLNRIPSSNVEKIPDFRAIGDEVPNEKEWSYGLRKTLELTRSKMEWISEYRKINECEPINFWGQYSLADSVDTVVEGALGILNLPFDWCVKETTKDKVFKYLRTKIESIGIIVLVSGIVGNNTHLPLDVKEFRGFVLKDEYAPTIFINGADALTARLFTLAHEFCHILIGEEGIGSKSESFCNSFAAKFLVPQQLFAESWEEMPEDYSALSKKFHVSQPVIYRVANTYGYINDEELRNLNREYYTRFTGMNSGGGNYYQNKVFSLGTVFGPAVIRAAQEGSLLFRDAYDMLGVNGRSFDSLVKQYEKGGTK